MTATAEGVRRLLTAGLATFEARPTAHTTGSLARDFGSAPCAAASEYAVCWCSLGHLLRTADTGSLDHPDVEAACALLQRAAVQLGAVSVSRCNDQQGRNGAIGMYRLALRWLDTEGLPTVAVLEGSTA